MFLFFRRLLYLCLCVILCLSLMLFLLFLIFSLVLSAAYLPTLRFSVCVSRDAVQVVFFCFNTKKDEACRAYASEIERKKKTPIDMEKMTFDVKIKSAQESAGNTQTKTTSSTLLLFAYAQSPMGTMI